MATTSPPSTSSSFRYPTIEETTNHPSYPSTIWKLEPHQSGLFPAAKGRGGPVNIAWEIHGTGPTKLVLVMGLAGVTASWQRQTRYFGHDRADQYSVLIMDNRGMGASDKPLSRYTTSEMALDVIEVIDHVGWTSPRSVHIAGISLGGMISQEVACRIPERLASLSLLCTSAEVKNTKTYREWITQATGFLVPKSNEEGIIDTARKIFVDEWLEAPDVEDPPSPASTSKCGPAPVREQGEVANGAGKGEYGLFDSNFQRFQAQELTKRRQPGYFTKQGFICQLLAAWTHQKSDAQLKKMADEVGRERIMVMHGNRDEMLKVWNGEHLIEAVRPGTGMIVEGMGHAPIMERFRWFNPLFEEKLEAWTKL